VGIAFAALFVVVWIAFAVAMVGGLIAAVSALVSAARLPAEAFGPWWDNTKSAWIIGIVVPFGTLVAGVLWFRTGKHELVANGVVGRPFWVGPAKPPPAAWLPDPSGRHQLRYWDGYRCH
jgi:hypothetical protein